MKQSTSDELPRDVLIGAPISGTEYGWTIASFPTALASAQAKGLACLGGQFQFRLPDGIYEMYWLEAHASDRGVGECWTDYARRSCSEIRQQFQQLVEQTNFVKEADHWPSLHLKERKESIQSPASFSLLISSLSRSF